MDKLVRRLYPSPPAELPLSGLYLSHELWRRKRDSSRPFIYSNFVASVDGRIAIPHPSGQGMAVPADVANERDWRLFQELAAQADLIISSGRYLREWAAGHVQEILQVDDPRFADLAAWRRARGLKLQPDIAIISNSLQFPIPDLLTAAGRRLIIFTKGDPDPVRAAQIEASGGQLLICGQERVDGAVMAKQISDLGYQTVYSTAGPQVLHMLLAAGVLNRLYVSQANRLLGGHPISTMVQGSLLQAAVDLQLSAIYLDPHALDGLGQLLLTYDCT